MRKNIVVAILSVILFASCAETRIKEHADWGKFFESRGIKKACFMLRDNNHESIHYYNKARCTERFMPASTFKVFNSLVALETAIAPDDQLVITWDSVARREDCDKDLTMREAFKASCLGYYQEIARRIGPTKMQHYLDTVKYGNMKMGGRIDNFWINQSLQISADEQTGFLKRMYFAELPFAERSQRIVKTMMLQEQTPRYNLYYKTGTGPIGDKYIYWVVGFAERIEHVKEPKGSMNKSDVRNYPYFFALNFEMPQADTSQDWFKARIEILHDVLKEYGAIPK
uniref:Crb2 n=1 Tax=uncultured bacterium AOCarb2 TaxID=654973 RepID=D6MLZ1_9BACT|nr:Crb2 [uncultured bacterium AOCarb2]